MRHLARSSSRPCGRTSRRRRCAIASTPQQWRRPAHHLISDAERIHDVEGEQRDMRRLQHIAAGVEHEVRRLGRHRSRRRFLAEPLQHRRHRAAIATAWSTSRLMSRNVVDALAAPLGQFVLAFAHGDARHRQQEARIDAVVARLDALAAEHAGGRPFARSLRPFAGADDVEHAADDVGGLASAMPAGFTLGQTSTHLPHCVQASSISSTRASSAVSNEISLIGCGSPSSWGMRGQSARRPGIGLRT